jgi:hypothetical protein
LFCQPVVRKLLGHRVNLPHFQVSRKQPCHGRRKRPEIAYRLRIATQAIRIMHNICVIHKNPEGAAYPFLVAMAAEGPDRYPIMAPAENRSRG